VTSCSLVNRLPQFRETCYFHLHSKKSSSTLKTAANSSQMLKHTCQIMWHHILKHSNLQQLPRESCILLQTLMFMTTYPPTFITTHTNLNGHSYMVLPLHQTATKYKFITHSHLAFIKFLLNLEEIRPTSISRNTFLIVFIAFLLNFFHLDQRCLHTMAIYHQT